MSELKCNRDEDMCIKQRGEKGTYICTDPDHRKVCFYGDKYKANPTPPADELGKLIEKLRMATEVNPMASQKALLLLAERVRDLSKSVFDMQKEEISISDLESRLAKVEEWQTDMSHFPESAPVSTNPQSLNPLSREEILKLQELIAWLNIDSDEKIKFHRELKSKIESYLKAKPDNDPDHWRGR